VKAIVGLGNPGRRYEGTRHNVGFAVLDLLAQRRGLAFESAPAEALVAKWRRPAAETELVLLAKPLTFMNASGQAVGDLVRYFKIPPGDLLIVVDEAALPLGRLRLRRSGSAGGHNGLKSIIQHVGSEFPRLRLGVGRGDPKWDLADHVLSTFEPEERQVVEEAVVRAADCVEAFVELGVDAAMNRYNVSGERKTDDQELK
jgi:PTH1 family peptidyl-tRNA hydrolase